MTVTLRCNDIVCVVRITWFWTKVTRSKIQQINARREFTTSEHVTGSCYQALRLWTTWRCVWRYEQIEHLLVFYLSFVWVSFQYLTCQPSLHCGDVFSTTPLLYLVYAADTDKTRLSCLVCVGGVNTTADKLDPDSNFQVFNSRQYIGDWTVANWKLCQGRTKLIETGSTRQNCLEIWAQG